MNNPNLEFPALHHLELDHQRLTYLKKEELSPFLEQPALLTRYADEIVQQQNQLITTKTLHTSHALSEVIRDMIRYLNESPRYLKPKKFNFLQKWLGIDLEQQVGSVAYLNELNQMVQKASRLSEKVSVEIYQSQKNMRILHDLRFDMAHYVVAAEQFLQEVHQFSSAQTIENIKDRLDKKINMLMTSQTATDMAMLQIQLSQNIALTILDRFNEAKNVLIPAWQQHVLQLQQAHSPIELQRLNEARDHLVDTLDRAIHSNQK